MRVKLLFSMLNNSFLSKGGECAAAELHRAKTYTLLECRGRSGPLPTTTRVLIVVPISDLWL